jgi:hypothetical protein
MSQRNDYEEHDSGGEKGSSQKILLLVLLLLVAVFAYLYFFTSLIRPQVAVVAPPVPQVAQVKQPIPPRAGQPAKSGEPLSPEAAKAVLPPGEKSGALPAPAALPKPVPAPPAKNTAPAVPAKTAVPATPPAPVPTKAEQAKPAAPVPIKADQVKPAATAPVKAEQVKSVAKTAEQPTAAAKPAVKKRVAAVSSPHKSTKSVAKKPKAVYALKVNTDLALSEVQPMLAKLKNVGLTVVALNKATREERMHRLFFAAFDRQSAAQAEAQKLQTLSPAAFILFENGKYSVYAGSYLREDKAIRERDRLFDKGVKLTVDPARVAVPVVKITAGHFVDSAEADKALKRLRKSGISATVVKAGI